MLCYCSGRIPGEFRSSRAENDRERSKTQRKKRTKSKQELENVRAAMRELLQLKSTDSIYLTGSVTSGVVGKGSNVAELKNMKMLGIFLKILLKFIMMPSQNILEYQNLSFLKLNFSLRN